MVWPREFEDQPVVGCVNAVEDRFGDEWCKPPNSASKVTAAKYKRFEYCKAVAKSIQFRIVEYKLVPCKTAPNSQTSKWTKY